MALLAMSSSAQGMNSKVEHDRMVIAGAVASRGLNDLTTNHLNAVICQDVIDAHG